MEEGSNKRSTITARERRHGKGRKEACESMEGRIRNSKAEKIEESGREIRIRYKYKRHHELKEMSQMIKKNKIEETAMVIAGKGEGKV